MVAQSRPHLCVQDPRPPALPARLAVVPVHGSHVGSHSFSHYSGAAGPCRVQIVPVLLGGVTLTPALAAPPAQLLSVLSVPEPPISGTRVLPPGCGCLCSTRRLRATQALDLPTHRHTPGPHGLEHTPCPTLLRAAVRVPAATCWRTAASRLSPSGTFHSATPASGLAADGLGWAGKHSLSGSLGPQTLLQAPGAGRGQVQSEESCLPEVDRAGQTWRRHGGCSPGPTARLFLCISGAGKIQGGPQGPEAAPSTPFLLVFRHSDVLDTRGEVSPSRKLGLVSVPPQPQGLARTPGAPHPGDSAHRGLGRGLPRRLGSWVPHPLDFQPDIISSQVCLHLLVTALGPPLLDPTLVCGSVAAAVSQAPQPLPLAHLLCGPLEGCGGCNLLLLNPRACQGASGFCTERQGSRPDMQVPRYLIQGLGPWTVYYPGPGESGDV